MDYSMMENPYNFGDPVEDVGLFAGRYKELDEIRYYMEHATINSRLFDIAILGERASGKTSLLNMCRVEAIQREFCVVRVDLDEADVDRLTLFHKIFDALVLTVCEMGYFGGLEGATYEQYLLMVSAYEVPADKKFCPFLFPIQYAHAMSADKSKTTFSDAIFKKDLKTIRDNIKRPILFLFDEANILAQDRINLEKIRNIFSNLKGFMIILAGTPDIFPSINEVFSPIARQFKKIYITGFGNREETLQCITKPLEFSNITPEFLFDYESPDFQEIHEISGGSPYEIQLICHFMFRRMQLLKNTKMKLSIDVLEEVRRALETSENMLQRSIITQVSKMSRSELEGLRIICSNNGKYTLEQCWTMEYILNNSKDWDYDKLSTFVKRLETLQIICVTDPTGVIEFLGDEFDRIYLKYFAHEKGIALKINSIVPEAPAYELFELMGYFEAEDGVNCVLGSQAPIRNTEKQSKRSDEESIENVVLHPEIWTES